MAVGSKSNQYVQSLTDFILDTKPFHSKLTSIIEEYQFEETVNVKMTDKQFVRAKLNSTWVYNFYSGGNEIFRTVPIARLTAPVFKPGTFTVGTDELPDFHGIRAYSKSTFANDNISGAFIQRQNGTSVRLIEGHDYFESHGAFEFQVRQTLDAGGAFLPQWTSTMDGPSAGADLVPSTALTAAQALIDEIEAKVIAAGNYPNVLQQVNELNGILSRPDLPRTYEPLLIALDLAQIPNIDVNHYRAQFRALMSSRQSGLLSYENITGRVDEVISPFEFRNTLLTTSEEPAPGTTVSLYINGTLRTEGIDYTVDGREITLTSEPLNSDVFRVVYYTVPIEVTEIQPDLDGDYEEWTLEAVDNQNRWRVTGSVTGFAGFVKKGNTFVVPGKISFKTSGPEGQIVGSQVILSPKQRVVVHKSAPLEAWNLIKVNPIAYSRPKLVSTQFGKIQDLSGQDGLVTLLNSAFPTSNLILEAREDGVTFDITSESDEGYQEVATVGVPFNDGNVGFIIVAGTSAFRQGDKFLIAIQNDPPTTENVDIGFGFDLDPFDNDHIRDQFGTLDFFYDGRFTDYDLRRLNIVVAENATSGRHWRARAIPNTNTPALIVNRDGTLGNLVDLIDATSGVAPDPALNAPPVYTAEGSTEDALRVFYADMFEVEWSDDGVTWQGVGQVGVGETFELASEGVKFTLAAGSKRFIAVSAYNGENSPRVTGGDTISFTVTNPDPYIAQKPIKLIADYLPRLIPRGDAFYEVEPARWTVRFTDASTYTVSAVKPNGENLFEPVSGSFTLAGLNSNEGFSFKDKGVHFTIVPGAGLAAGDYFTFETFSQKASFLVHGSVTGFTAPAEIGKYYWNGKIGFKIEKPRVDVFNSEMRRDETLLTVQRVRDDTPSLCYRIVKTANGFMVSRSDVGPVGFIGQTTATFTDKFITFELNSPSNLTEALISIKESDITPFKGQDAIILNSNLQGIPPVAGDVITIEKSENPSLRISLPRLTAEQALKLRPAAIDASLGFPVVQSQPETTIIKGWLPIFSVKEDSATSVAHFNDSVATYRFYSAASGEAIGTTFKNTDGTQIFEWDIDFFKNYLPLNAEANIVVHETGWNDPLRVFMKESLRFLIRGALDQGFMFKDEATLSVTEDGLEIDVELKFEKDVVATIQDTPFGGFLPGYDNQQFEAETGNAVGGSYDEGQPLTLFGRLDGKTGQERQAILDAWNFYLPNGREPVTTEQLDEMQARFDADDPNPGSPVAGFGHAARGLGILTDKKNEGEAETSVIEDTIITATDIANSHDTRRHDFGGIDDQEDKVAFILTGTLAPTVIPSDATFESLDVPLGVDRPSRTFEITLKGLKETTVPLFSIWLEGAAEPQPIPSNLVERYGAEIFRFSIPKASKAKIILA